MRYTEAPQRRAELLRRVGAAGYLSSGAVAAALGVSEMTIRRDLRELAAQGLVNRVPGGASVVPDAGTPFEDRRAAATAEKAALAQAAVELLAGAEVVALDSGTTVAALTALLPPGLTVVTHSVPVVLACAQRDDLELISLGGAYHAKTRSFTGPLTRAALGQLAVDVAVLSAQAVGAAGVYSADAWDAETKRTLADIAERVLLLVDSGKLAGRAPIRVLAPERVDSVVVDDRASRKQLTMLRRAYRSVVVAPVDDDVA